ncbi:MAG TPA: hypothetical protein VL172_09190, partial [Kofleriaceae bacterium]|nr:hypothetical protein [Kofleriaceae bacterium]
PGDHCSITVRFDPAAVGSATGSITVSGDPGGNAVVALGGTGFAVVSVGRSGSGAGKVASTPGGIDCGAVCQLSFTTPAVSLTPTAEAGTVFAGWAGACTGGAGCALDLNGGDAVVTARFEAMRTLTVTRAGTGGGTVTSMPSGIDCGTDCTDSYLDGASITLTAAAAAGSQLAGWTGCDSTTATTCTVAMSAARTVTATFNLQVFGVSVGRTGAGGGSVSSAPAGINCGTDCSEPWAYGTALTLTATPAVGSTFVGWTGCDAATGTSCTLTVNGVESVTADFDLISYTMTATTGGTGSGTVTSSPAGIACPGDCTQSYTHGTSVTLTAAAAAGSSFAGWTGCDSSSGATCTVSVNGAESVGATFTLQNHVLTVATSGGGTGSVASTPAGIACPGDCTQSWAHGTLVTLTAPAGGGSTFAGWTGCDAPSGATCTVTLDAVETVTAAFELQGYTVGVTTRGNGSGSVTSSPAGIACPGDCSDSFSFGTSVTLTANAAAGSTFSGWSGCTSSSGNQCTVSVDGAESVIATFSLISYAVNLTVAGAGSGSVSSSPAGIACPGDCTQSWAYGTVVTLTAAADPGSTFAGWTGCDAPSGATCTVTVSGIENVSASFAVATPSLTVSLGGTGGGTVSSSPAGIACPGDCAQDYAYGTTVTLTATPAAGSQGVIWSGGCDTSSANTCTVAVTAARNVTATFNLTVHGFDVSIGGNGSGTVTSSPAGIGCPGDCSQNWNYGTAVTLTAAAGVGSTFAGWTGCDSSSGATCTVSVNGTEAVTATFTLQSLAVSVGKNGTGSGTVTSNPAGISCGSTCSASWNYGTALVLNAAPSAGSTFNGWSGCDSSSGTTCNVTVNGAETVTASFTLNSYTLTVGKSGSGAAGTVVTSNTGGISCGSTCSASYLYGSSVTLTPTLPSGAYVYDWTGCTSRSGNSCTVVVDGTENPVLTVIQSYYLTINKGSTGTGTVTSSPSGQTCDASCSASSYPWDAGTTVTLTATPSSTSTWGSWSGCDSTSGMTCTVTMNAARSVTANFHASKLTVTVTGTLGDSYVTSSPSGIFCGADCTQVYNTGTVVTLTRANGECEVFKGWSGSGCSGLGSTCTVTVSGSKSVTATFGPQLNCTPQ